MILSSTPALGGEILQVETGLQQLMGDRVLYRQILRRFRHRYQDSAHQARDELLAGDSVAARRIVHTLKGAAGMIGAQQLYLLALSIEPLFAGPAAPCMGPLVQLEQVLRTLMVAVDAELDAADPSDEPTPPPTGDHRPETRMLVVLLARLLEEGDGAAIDVLEQSATALAASLGVEVFQEVTEAAHQFDFEAALEVLQAADRAR